MGSGVSSLFPCIKPPPEGKFSGRGAGSPDLDFEPLDETLGHSFCYVRSSNRFLSPTASDRFVVVSPSISLRFSPPGDPPESGPSMATAPAGFKAISGASVSANTFTPRTVDGVYDGAGGGGGVVSLGGFESTSLFSALPLQPAPRGGEGYFLSGPLERGALSGPLDPNTGGGGGSDIGSSRVPFSAPLGGAYVRKRGRKGISGIKKAIHRNISEKKKQLWVVPVWRERGGGEKDEEEKAVVAEEEDVHGRVQWALGKAGEDRVHVVVSEEQGWLFVGIYDGFNGPDAPEFLMGNLYKAVYSELQGLFWEVEEEGGLVGEKESNLGCDGQGGSLIEQEIVKKVRFQSDGSEIVPRKRLWEFLAEEKPEDGLDLSGSERFAFSVDDAINVGNAGSAVSRRWLLLSKLKQGLSRHRDRKLFPWKHGLEGKEAEEEKMEAVSSRVEERGLKRRRKVGPVDHQLVLSAMSRALEVTELAYLDMTDKVLDTNPELALMGSCLLVVLMREEDVYVMNVGDSRAIVAQNWPQDVGASSACDSGLSTVGISEGPAQPTSLAALQLSTDHSTSIEEEVIRIKSEHPDDSQCIVNDRVKGRLKVTRAFGAGSLKKPKYNDALLEMFRNQYIGTAPYISCQPSLHHHRLCPMDQFLVLSSDGLYQYLTNEEVVSDVESFMEKFPDGDPAQHLIEEVLSRAAKKAGMDFHELLDIPQGDRRKYHDDVTVMVVSLEGRIWKSSGKYL